LSVTDTADASGNPVQVRLDWVTPAQQTANNAAAVAAAKNANTAVVFAWADGRTDLSSPLPEGQDQLIEDVAKVNPNTIVVLNTSEPIAMPWLSQVKSVLEMWYPGDRGGYATASVLLGKTDPAGKLPFTWPTSITQEVAHQAAHPERTSAGVTSSGTLCTATTTATCTTTYSEGINIGYRFFDATGETPLYPFGYGLSYTSFSYSSLHVTPARDGGLNVTFKVTNTGSTAGEVAPQVYLGAPESKPAGVQFADKALAGYSRTRSLWPGQSETITIQLPERQLQYWSTADSRWKTATGTRTLYVATNERSSQLSTQVTIH
jgi:beta-glucosidase